MTRYRDSRTRSLAKSLGYRVLTIAADVIVIYWITHGVAQTIALTIFTNIASTVLYYGHERVWNAVRWGRIRT